LKTAHLLTITKLILGFSALNLQGKVDFNRQIRPILSDKCYKCHGPDAKNQKSDFRIDSFEEAIKEHNGFVGLTPGNLEESEIHWRIYSDDPIDVMPPPESKHPLTEAEKKLIDQWIKEGGKYDKHWSFQPLPKAVPVPVSNHPSPRNEIDHFVARKLEGSSLHPSKETDKTSWLRRVSYDLTGLPPSLEEVDAFLADSTKEAYEKVLNRLLDTDEYAERMTSEWLDVARYSDTYGYQVDRNRNVWPWRDWVIQSFRKNQAYDQFVTEQIAGDLIPNATRDQILATCFNRLHPQKVEGGSVPEEFRIEYVADRVHTFGTAFLGLTMECTRCHDHKYDPVTQKDYFSLSAFFNNIDEAGLYSYFTGSTPTPTLELGDLPSDEKIRIAEKNLKDIIESTNSKDAFANWIKEVRLETLGRANYFSKPIKNPDPNKVDPAFNPLSLKPALWFDANEYNSTSGNWADRSGNQNHGTRHATPKINAHKPSGLQVVRYQLNDYHQFKEIKNIRTVFWVMSKTPGNSGSPLCHQSAHHFYSNGNKFWHPQHTHEHIRKGSLRINGMKANAESEYPNELAVVSLRTTGNVIASRLGKDRTHGGNYNWNGEIGELLIFSSALNDQQIEKMENHLINKWKIKRAVEITYAKPMAYLSFDDREGNRYLNSADRSKDANTNGNNKEVEGKYGKAIHFTGDDVLSFPSGFGDFTRHHSFTMAFWIKPTEELDRAVVVRRSKAWTDAASRGIEVLIENGRLSPALIHFWPGNAIRIQAKEKLPINQWTHIGLTYDGSSRASGLTLFENGKLANTEVIKDHLTREITGGGDPFIGFAQRMRDRGFKNGLLDEFYLYDRVISGSEIEKLAGLREKIDDSAVRNIFLHSAHAPSVSAKEQLQAERRKFGDQRQRLTEIMVMKEMPGIRETHILERGHYENRGQVVERATPEVLTPFLDGASEDRLGLAKWLTATDHPLLARVTVNRYWQMIFGRGLVSTSEDFGMQGKPPTHPSLLDWLARDFVSSGWNLHHLLKKMVLSHTYRQESKIIPMAQEKDPENLLLSRSSAYRLPAEMIRDGLLTHSQLLHKKVGGASSKPYDLKVSFKPINPDGAPNVYRRSLYTFWKRTGPTPVMMALDASKRDVCTVRRERTDSPSQSLILLNGTQFVETARALADKLIARHGEKNPMGLINDGFRQLTSRYPSEKEAVILLNLLREQKEHFADSKEADKFLKVGYYMAKSKNSQNLAAVTSLISTLMNFDETISKR
jgi:hypothetical protein